MGEAGGTVECRFSDGAWGACTSVDGTAGKFTLTNLTGGDQSISVRQTDDSGNTSEVGSVYLAPKLIDVPIGLVTKNGLTFKLAHAARGELWCEVSLTGGSADFRPCGNLPSWLLPALGVQVSAGESVDGVTTDTIAACSPDCPNDGMNTLRYKQVIDGQASLVAEVSWTQDRTGPYQPTLSGTPSSFTSSRSASIGFTYSETNITFECSLDGGPYSACASPKTLSDLSDGSHTLNVRGTDSLGNVGYPVGASWTVDTVSPEVPTVASPANSGVTGATVPFTANGEEGATLLCSLDGGAFARCPAASGSPGDKSTLNVGWNTRLHWGESPDWSAFEWGTFNNSYGYDDISWRGERVASGFPDGVTLAAIWPVMPASSMFGTSCAGFQQYLWTSKALVGVPNGGSDPTVYNSFDVDCSDTSTGEVPPGSPAQFTSLGDGKHTLLVKQRDKAGNESLAASRTWTVASSRAQRPGRPSVKWSVDKRKAMVSATITNAAPNLKYRLIAKSGRAAAVKTGKCKKRRGKVVCSLAPGPGRWTFSLSAGNSSGYGPPNARGLTLTAPTRFAG